MKFTTRLVVATTFALLFSGAIAQVTVSGVRFEEGVDVKGAKLQLNGAGVRYKAIFKVYAAGLYLSRKSGTADEAVGAPGGKRITLTMLRDLDAADLGKLFASGMEENSDKATFAALAPAVKRMSQIFADQKKLNSGDSFAVDWVPGTGTVVTVRGVPQGEPFVEPEFYGALLRIWLGPHPADAKLKEALLGKAS
jgi:hypothetical protein